MILTSVLRGFRSGFPRLWMGGLAIALSVAFVVAGTMVASSVRGMLTQQDMRLPLNTTAVLAVDGGRVPPAAAAVGMPATDRTVVLLGPDGRAEVAGRRNVALADDRAVRLLSGAMPSAADEVALGPRTARILAAQAGDAVHVRDSTGAVRTLTLTGIADPRMGSEAVTVTAVGMQDLLGAGFDQVLLFGSPSENKAATSGLGLGEAVALTDVTAEVAGQRARAGSGLGTLGALLSALTWVAAVAGTFVIANTFGVVAAGRRREAALLRAVGASRRQVRNQFLAEAVLLGAMGSAAGVVAGAAVGALISPHIGVAVHAGRGLIALGLVLGMTVTLIGTWGPIRTVAGVAPVTALGEAELAEVAAPSRTRWGLALPLLLLAGLALQVPIVGAVIGGSLTFICLVLLGPLLVPRMGSWLMSGPGRRGPIARLARANVTSHPSRSARTASALLLGVALATSTTALVSALGEVHELGADRQVTVYAPTVTTQMARQLGKIDGVVSVSKPRGSQLDLETAGSADAVAREAAAVVAAWPGAHVGSTDDRRADTAAWVWISISLGSVAAMSLVVGLLGVLNAVRLSTHERRREFAVLRAVGMTRRQLLQLVIAEASGLTGIGVVMGLALAAATLYGMIGSFSLLIAPFVAWSLVAAICGGLVATAAIAAIAPARTAAQVPPALAAAQAAG